MTGCHSTNDVSNKGKTAKEIFPPAAALPFIPLPEPYSLAAAAARSRGGLGGADVGWRAVD